MKKRQPMHDNWATPRDLYDRLDAEFHFDLDPCPLNSQYDGLAYEWTPRITGPAGGEHRSVFINPPYSRELKEAFVRKAQYEATQGSTCVCLLPVSTSTKLFHEVILPHAEIRFLRGRVKFAGINSQGEHVTSKVGMHDSMICIFRPPRDKLP